MSSYFKRHRKTDFALPQDPPSDEYLKKVTLRRTIVVYLAVFSFLFFLIAMGFHFTWPFSKEFKERALEPDIAYSPYDH